MCMLVYNLIYRPRKWLKNNIPLGRVLSKAKSSFLSGGENFSTVSAKLPAVFVCSSAKLAEWETRRNGWKWETTAMAIDTAIQAICKNFLLFFPWCSSVPLSLAIKTTRAVTCVGKRWEKCSEAIQWQNFRMFYQPVLHLSKCMLQRRDLPMTAPEIVVLFLCCEKQEFDTNNYHWQPRCMQCSFATIRSPSAFIMVKISRFIVHHLFGAWSTVGNHRCLAAYLLKEAWERVLEMQEWGLMLAFSSSAKCNIMNKSQATIEPYAGRAVFGPVVTLDWPKIRWKGRNVLLQHW